MADVKCTICGKKFDKDIIQAVITKKYEKRKLYAHLSCCPQDHSYELVPLNKKKIEKQKYDKNLEELKHYIMKLYDEDYVYPRILNQIDKFKQKGFTPYGILMTLKYAYEIKNMDLDKARGGIGIVEYLYKDAHDYWITVETANKNNKNIKFDDKIVKVNIKYITPMQEQMKLFNMEE